MSASTTNPAASGISGSPARLNLALSVLRVIIGVVFVAHGAQKLFVFGIGGVIQSFDAMGVPFAAMAGTTASLVEFVGGLALLLGLFTRPAAVALAALMASAIILVHLPAGFFMPAGMEFALTLFAGVVAIALAGPGPHSVDAVRARRSA